MDPVVTDGIYNFNNILFEFYRPELAKEYMKIWDESLATSQIEYDMTQSDW